VAGALTGLIVGLTGVGGGALMTPILLLFFGVAPLTAVGTDLWFAAITKMAITSVHQRERLIDWQIVRRLWLGSLTASAAAVTLMHLQPVTGASIQWVKGGIAFVVCLTAVGLTAQTQLQAMGARLDQRAAGGLRRWQTAGTVTAGALLGVLVTLTSVGAGALGVICLLYLYPSRLTPPRLIATDVAHAIPLAMFAGIGHLTIGSVDSRLLRDLLIGSLPAALLGAFLSSRLPHTWLRWALAAVLFVIGVKLALDLTT
jgi:hypothetical protein